MLLDEADVALRDGNLGEYQEKVDEAGTLIDQALELLGATGDATSGGSTAALDLGAIRPNR